MKLHATETTMQDVRRGSRTAFHGIVTTHQDALLCYCQRFLGDDELARDLVQEVFLTLWRERESYQEEGKLRFFLLRIARLRCLAALKKRRSRTALSTRVRSTVADQTGGPSPQESRVDAVFMERCLRRLKPENSDLLILRHLEGLDLAEIHEVTGLPVGTIKSRLSRALVALRKELSSEC